MQASTIATLGIEFQMTTSGAVTSVGQLGGAIDDTVVKAALALNKLQPALDNAVNTSAAQASMKQLGDVAAQISPATVRQLNAIERAGESMAASLTRQLSVYGMSATEIRSMKTETAALAAEQAGMTELAGRLRDVEAELYAVELAAARKATTEAQAAAEEKATADAAAILARAAASLRDSLDPLAAAQQRANAEIATATELFAAGRISLDEYAAAETKVQESLATTTAALERQAAAAKSATITQNTPAQTQINTSVGTGFGEAAGSAEASARAMATLLAEEEQLEARTRSLVAAIDPMAAAQQRANAMVAEARALYDADRISAEQLAAAEKLAADAAKGHSVSLGLNSTQIMIAEGATHRFVDSLLAGTSPMRAFMMQAGDIGNVLAMDNGGVSGGLAKVAALINPVTIGIAALTVTLAAGVVSWLSYTSAMDRFDALSQGSGAVIGATGLALQANAEAAAAAGNISVSSAQAIESEYVKLGGIGTGVLAGLTAITSDFAKATGQDAAGAEAELGAAFQDPVKGAQDLTAKFGTLTQAQIDHIQQLVQQNDLYGAQQALLAGLTPQFDKATEHANGLALAWHNITTAASDAWTAMGKAIAVALGGGSTLDQLNKAFSDRAKWLQQTGGYGNTSSYDTQIATLQAQLKAQQQQQGVALAKSQAVGVMKTVGSATGDDQLDGMKDSLAKINGLLADTSNKAGLSAAQITQLRQAQEQYTHAVQTYRPEGEKEVQLAQLSADIAAAKGNPAKLAQLNAEKSLIEQGGKLITSSQAQAIATANGAAARDKATKSDQSHIDTLARAAAAQEAQIRNLYAVADAYKVSDAAALVAEARVKAESEAIKQRGDIEAAVTRQIQILVAQRVADGEKEAAGLRAQTDAQKTVNDEVAAGLIPASQANDALRDIIALRPLETALAVAQSRGDVTGAKAAQGAIDDLKSSQLGYNAAKKAAQFIQDTKQGDNQIAELQMELQLIGATDAARVHALATLQATQAAEAKGYNPAQAATYIAQQVTIADQTQANKAATDAYNISLDYQANVWSLISTNVQTAASDMSDAFGTVGKSIGDLSSAVVDLQAKQAAQARDETAALKNLTVGSTAYNQTVQEYATKGAITQVKAYGDMVEAAQGFFKKGSAGYKVMGDAEKAFRTIELALAIKSAAEQIGLIGTRTAATVIGNTTMAASDTARAGVEQANSVATTAVKAVEAVVNAIRSLPFPANLIAGAATAAAIVALGVAVGGGFGGGSNPLTPANEGTGTVFGDDSAKSDSILQSIDALKDVDTSVFNTSREMLQALKSIDSQIGSLTNTLISAGNIGDAVGVSANSGGAFGTTKKILGTGVIGGSESLSDVLSSGSYDTDYYADIEKKKKLFGITTSTKYKTETADDGSDIDDQFALILKGFSTAIEDAAGPLGQSTSDVEARLNSFVVDIGKIDLTGLSGDDIEKKLEAVFSAEGDKLAAAAIPGLQKYQQAGEGYLQTLTRVASTVETVTDTLDKLGVATSGLGIDADMGIAKQFDSLSDFTDAANTYFQDYYSQTEQAAAETQQLGKVFGSLGLQMPDTLDGFRKLVEAQDLTTTAGQQTYATLLQIAPAFSDLKTSMDGAKSAADILSEQQDLQQQLLEQEGDQAAIRAAALAKIDPSNQPIQEHIWALQDEATAEDAAAKVAQERAGLETQLLTLEGDTNALRQQQLDALDPTNRALQQMIFALQDTQAAASAAAAVAQQRAGIETSLLQLEGNTVAIRANELSGLDASNRALQEQVYALQDQQAAVQAATQAEAAFTQERVGIENTLLQLQGNTAAIRTRELEALDPANRAIQQLVYNLQDQQAATEAASQAADEAAQKQAAIDQERAGLEQQLWQLQGNTAALRQAQLDSLDPSNRALQEQIYAVSDAQDAAKAAQDLADAWTTIGDSIMDEVKRIRGLSTTSGSTYASLLGQFNAATVSARGGDQDAAKSLPDLSKSLLDAAEAAATSRQDLARIQAQTAASLEATYALVTSATAASNAATSTVLPASSGTSDSDSLDAQSWWSTFASNTAATGTSSTNDNVAGAIATLTAKVDQLRTDNNSGNAAIAGSAAKSARILEGVTRQNGGNAISTVAA